MDRPALGKVAITSPATWKALRHYNAGRPYRQQIKPFGFLLHAPGAGDGEQIGRLVAPYNNDPRRWLQLRWTDLSHPDVPLRISPDPTLPRSITADTYRSVADRYFRHREAKANGAEGRPCGRTTAGLLRRRHVVTEGIRVIGKEANDLDDRAAGMPALDDTTAYVTTYRPTNSPALSDDELAQLRRLGAPELARRTGLAARRIRDVLNGRSRPRKSTVDRLRRASATS